MQYIRLPDTYYTTQILDGTSTPPPTQLPLIEHYVGEDITLEAYLTHDGKPVLITDWTLTAVLNTNQFANKHSWDGVINNGIYSDDTAGHYKIIIPSEVTTALTPGTYWLNIVATEKLGSDHHAIKDQTLILGRYPISLSYSGALPQTFSSGERQQLEQTAPLASDPTTHLAG